MAHTFSHHVLRSAKTRFTQLASTASIHAIKKIGRREMVGYGLNGTPCYMDRTAFPMPAIRFKEPSNESRCLRLKEQSHWNKMTLQEKKALYRYSFCQTFTEMKAGTGEWKLHIGIAMLAISIGVSFSIFCNLYVYPELPESFDEEHQKAQLRRMLDLQVNPIHGLSSKWDYEKDKWKR